MSAPFGSLCWLALLLTAPRTLGFPPTLIYSSPQRYAMNTERRFLFTVRRSFSELSKAAVTSLYGAVVRRNYAMEVNYPNLIADIFNLVRVQRIAGGLLKGPRLLPYKKRLC